MPVQRPVLKTFLTLTPPPSKESPPSAKPSSLRSSSGESLPDPSPRTHRGSSSSVSSTGSDVGENGYLVLTSVEKGSEDLGLKKIVEEEAVE
jgi:hypothetical protein